MTNDLDQTWFFLEKTVSGSATSKHRSSQIHEQNKDRLSTCHVNGRPGVQHGFPLLLLGAPAPPQAESDGRRDHEAGHGPVPTTGGDVGGCLEIGEEGDVKVHCRGESKQVIHSDIVAVVVVII